MKAITVQQPWAWAIVHGGKDTENRTGFHQWKRADGQTLAVHAGQRLSARGVDDARCRAALKRVLGKATHWYDEHVVFGAIVGLVDVLAVHEALTDCCQPWGETEYVEHGGRRADVVHLVLANPRPIDPIRCRGALGLWTVPDDVEAELLAAVSR